MPKTCNVEGCSNRIWGKGYCTRHQYLRTDKKPKRIKPYSEKRQQVNVIYNEEARKYRHENPFCVIKSPNCTGRTQGVNHKKGRGKYILDKSTWEPSCNPCNTYCEDHTEWAIANGHKLLRHTNEKTDSIPDSVSDNAGIMQPVQLPAQ